MSGTAVIVPFKAHGAKSRLSRVASKVQRDELALALLESVLGVLGDIGMLASTFVVTSDPRARSVATELGACEVMEKSDIGVNGAVEAGESACPTYPDVLVLPSDLPFLVGADVRSLIETRRRGLDVVITPSRAFDGTNAYLYAKNDKVPKLYDMDSFWGHVSGVAARGLTLGVSTRPGLTFDVDSPEDLRLLSNSRKRSRVAEIARGLLK
ncbi:MAG TPA: 2-phospho-L-lactate guanylyltransferase [Nitrososphaerales archaeon]|nr:2-phospho-L-lactate guanylyltransferase [Nitrososphaerales archaeon]